MSISHIWTTYLPAHFDSEQSKPVMFEIHDGAFTSHSANDPTFEGGNIASRGHVVIVAINSLTLHFGIFFLSMMV